MPPNRSPLRSGARDLGLETVWRFVFVGPGSVLQPTRDAVVLDVGGSLQPGILDQHGGTVHARSTTELLLRYPEHAYGPLVEPWLARRDDGQDLRGRRWSPAIVTHRDPDFDALVACHLTMHLVEHGELPPYAVPLTEYATEIDTGRYSIDPKDRKTETHAIHMAYLAIQHLEAPAGSCVCDDEWRLRRGLDLIEGAMASVRVAREVAGEEPLRRGLDLHPGHSGVAAWRDDLGFADIRQELDDDRDRWDEDVRDAVRTEVALPSAADQSAIKVPTIRLKKPPKSMLSKYYARASRGAFLVCPYDPAAPRGVDSKVITKVILSLDPNWRDPQGRRPSLVGLGRALERAEVEARSDEPGGDTRGRTPRFDDGSCDNDDPWYDGRGHEYTIVDAPRSGTHLPYERIWEIAQSEFWELPLEELELVVVSPEREGAGIDLGASGDGFAATAFAQWSPSALGVSGRSALSSRIPEGLRTSEPELLVSRKDFCEPHRVLRVSAVEGKGFRLGALMRWIQGLRDEVPDRCYTVVIARVPRGAGPDAWVRQSLQRLVGGGQKPLAEMVLGSDKAWVGGTTLVLQRTAGGAVAANDEHREIVGALLHAILLHATLRSFARRIADAVDAKTGQVRGGGALRKSFLEFQARFYRLEVSRDSVTQALFQGFVAELGVERSYAEVQSLLDRLEQIEDRDASEQIEGLLFVVGLSGVMQTVMSVSDDVRSVAFWKWWTIAGLLITLGTAYVWLRRRRR